MARYTGWGKDYIQWDLGLAEGHAMIHAFLRMQNVPTAWTKDGIQKNLLKILDDL